MEIDYEIISTVIPSTKKGCFQLNGKYVHKVLVNCLVQLAQEKVWLGDLDMTIAVDWDVKHQTKQTKPS